MGNIKTSGQNPAQLSAGRRVTTFIPVKLKETYWMYWGESDIYAATSDDLIHWTPVEFLADGADPSHSFSQHDSRCKDNDEVARVLLPTSAPESATMMNFCASRALRQS